MREKLAKKDAIRIWSAGCSTGQEPYSLVIDILEKCGNHPPELCKVLATDIDVAVLAHAKKGLYSSTQITGLPAEMRSKYLSEVTVDGEKIFQFNDDICNRITFRRLNLHQNWPMKKKFDVIFCRNVLIYFDSETQNKLWPRFHKALSDRGIICIGHSERINSDLFLSVGSTTYKKAN